MFHRLLRLLLIITLTLSSAAFAAADPSRYTDNLNGTITDTTTGIIWMHCSLGQTWTIT